MALPPDGRQFQLAVFLADGLQLEQLRTWHAASIARGAMSAAMRHKVRASFGLSAARIPRSMSPSCENHRR